MRAMLMASGPRRHWMPGLVFAAGLGVTAATAMYASRVGSANERLLFDNQIEKVRHAINSQVDSYMAILRGAAGLFAASDDVSAAEFRAYVERLELRQRYRGVQGIGFSLLIRSPAKADVAARLHAEGLSSFHFWPRQSAPVIHAIVFLEPLDERNKRALGYDTLEGHQAFAARVEETKWSLIEFLIAKRREGKRIAGYGAPGKGNTLLNYCGIRTDLLDYTVDRNPYKQGQLLPGTHIPILHPEALERDRPDYILILPWNLKEEIVAQLEYARGWGAQFIVPIPQVQVL